MGNCAKSDAPSQQPVRWELAALVAIGFDDQEGLAAAYRLSPHSPSTFQYEGVYQWGAPHQVDPEPHTNQPDAPESPPLEPDGSVLAIGSPEGILIATRVALGEGTQGSDLLVNPDVPDLAWVRLPLRLLGCLEVSAGAGR